MFFFCFLHIAYGRFATRTMAYIHDPVSPPPGRDQLMRLPHPLPIRPLENNHNWTKPGPRLRALVWDHPRSIPVPALPAPCSPTSTSSSYIIALRPHTRLVLHARSSILVSRPTVISMFLQIAPPNLDVS
jgi:hypothetical protein